MAFTQPASSWPPSGAASSRASATVEGLDLEILKGCIYGLLGPNGSGKSTCIRALCGLLRPTSGAIQLLGRNAHDDRAHLRPRLGYMPQQGALCEDLSASEKLEFCARGLSVPEPRRRARAPRTFPFIPAVIVPGLLL